MNNILEQWQAMEDSDKEHSLFEAYVRAREAYLEAVREHVRGKISADTIPQLYESERAALGAYIAHRTKTKAPLS
jgi:hypothetical protein